MLKRTALTLALCMGIGGAFAQSTTDIEKSFKARFPNTQITSIKEAVVSGLYEIVAGKNVFYADPTGRYLVFGNIFDSQTQRDLTEERKQRLSAVDFNKLPLENAIKTVKGNGSRVVAVFSDPDCPYCKKLENELAQLENVTIYTFMFPIASLHPQAPQVSAAIWCSSDRSAAWADYTRNGKAPNAAACDNPVQKNIQLAQSLGINGTPYLIAVDGRILPGAAPAQRIESWLVPTAVK